MTYGTYDILKGKNDEIRVKAKRLKEMKGRVNSLTGFSREMLCYDIRDLSSEINHLKQQFKDIIDQDKMVVKFLGNLKESL